MKPVRVLIVDDSRTMRELIAARLASDPEIEVVGVACDAFEAREAIKALSPDVITLDVEMPKMSGLEFLERLMRLRPMPVVMVSSHTGPGAAATLDALALGAFDAIEKTALHHLAATVKAAALACIGAPKARAAPAMMATRPSQAVVAIGASTGGVDALIQVLSAYPENGPPTLIVQHMPATFTAAFAELLNRNCRPAVTLAAEGAPLTPGRVYLAPGGRHLTLAGGAIKRCRLIEASPRDAAHVPSIDMLFASCAEHCRASAVGVILTGMGSDGAAGLLKMRLRGARTLGQDEATCVIYGMPRAAHALGGVERQLPLQEIGPAILAHASGMAPPAP